MYFSCQAHAVMHLSEAASAEARLRRRGGNCCILGLGQTDALQKACWFLLLCLTLHLRWEGVKAPSRT